MLWFRGAALYLAFVTIFSVIGALPTAVHSFEKLQSKPGKLWEKLGLTPQQKQRMNELHQKSSTKMRAHKKSLATAKKELAELKNSGASAGRVTQKQNEVASIQLKISELRKEYTTAMKEILTPEQWTKLQKLKKEHRGNRDED
jgi:Spy/CpxP family protein refolding chaperone